MGATLRALALESPRYPPAFVLWLAVGKHVSESLHRWGQGQAGGSELVVCSGAQQWAGSCEGLLQWWAGLLAD